MAATQVPGSVNPPLTLSSDLLSRSKEFAGDARCHKFVLCCNPFDKEPCQAKALGSDRILAWTSTSGFVVMNRDGEILAKVKLYKKKAIQKIIVFGQRSFAMFRKNNRVYLYNLDGKKLSDITHAKSGALHDTVHVVVGGMAWASRKNSIILIDSDSGKKIFKAKLPEQLTEERVTAITSIGNDMLVVGTSCGRIVSYNRADGKILSHFRPSEEAISRLIGNDSGSLAIESPSQVSILENIRNPDSKLRSIASASLMTSGRSFQGSQLLIKYEKSFAMHMAAMGILNVTNLTSVPLEEKKFWPGSHAEFANDGQVVGGGGSEYRPFQIWNASTGVCETETYSVESRADMVLMNSGIFLCPAATTGVGLVDVVSRNVTLVSTPDYKAKINSFFPLSDKTIVATADDGGVYTFDSVPAVADDKLS